MAQWVADDLGKARKEATKVRDKSARDSKPEAQALNRSLACLVGSVLDTPGDFSSVPRQVEWALRSYANEVRWEVARGSGCDDGAGWLATWEAGASR